MPLCTLWRNASRSWPVPTYSLASGSSLVAWWLQLWLTRTTWSSETKASPFVKSSGWARSMSVWPTHIARSLSPMSSRSQRFASHTCAYLSSSATVWCPGITPRARRRRSGRENAKPSAWWRWWSRRLQSAGFPSVSSTSCGTSISTWLTSAISCSFSCCATCAQWAPLAVTLFCMRGYTIASGQNCERCLHVTDALVLGYLPTTVRLPAWCSDKQRNRWNRSKGVKQNN